MNTQAAVNGTPQSTILETRLKHLVSADQFTIQMLENLYRLTLEMEEFWEACQEQNHELLPNNDVRRAKKHFLHQQIHIRDFLQRYGVRGRKMLPVFQEESLRTRVSFCMAWDWLGGDIPTFTAEASKFSSAMSNKGEPLEDAIQVVACYGPNVIVLRHRDDDAAERAVGAVAGTRVSIINAGSGTWEHPTQALLDWITLRRLLGRIDHIRIGFMGDIKHGRTVRSLAKLLSKYQGVEMYFIAPQVTQITPELRRELDGRGVTIHEIGACWQGLLESNGIQALYQTRLQRDRIDNPQELEEAIRLQPLFTITPKIGQLMQQKGILLLHPRPISDLQEIHPDCGKYDIAVYKVLQIQVGLWSRMALLSLMYGPKGTALAGA